MKVSCIIPTYNCGQYIEKLLDQLTSYESSQIEIIVIDDGSTDNTKEVLDRYVFDNLKCLHIENSGVSAARNKGISIATGDYLIFFDADDEIDLVDFKSCVDTIFYDKANSDIYMVGYNIINQNNKEKISTPLISGVYGKQSLNNLKERLIDVKFAKNYTTSYIGGKVYQYFVKKSLFEKGLSFQQGIHFAEDLCYCMQLFDLANNITVLNFYPYIYNVIEGSASHRYRENMWYEWKSNFEYIKNFVEDQISLNRLIYWAGKVSIREYAKYEKLKNCRKKIKDIINDDMFIKAINDIDFDKWTVLEKMENHFINKKEISLLLVYEFIFRNFKKIFQS